MRARRVRVAGEREAADDRVAVLGDEDRRVGMRGARPSDSGARRRQRATCPSSAATRRARVRPRPRGRRAPTRRTGRRAGSRSRTTTPCPPRRGSPAAAERAVRTPLDGGNAAEEEVAIRPADDVPARVGELRRDVRRPSRPRGGRSRRRHGAAGASIASSTGMAVADDAADDLERSPRAAARSRRCRRRAAAGPVVEHERRRHHARQPLAGWPRLGPDHVELAQHVVQLEAAPEDARAGAERRREPDRRAVAVDDRDVRRARRPRCPRRRRRRPPPIAAQRTRPSSEPARRVERVERREPGLHDRSAERRRGSRQHGGARERVVPSGTRSATS